MKQSRLNGIQLFVWSAIDPDTKELLAVYASYQRSSINAILFIRMVLNTCTNKPAILVDGGPWYPWALERYELQWLHITFGKRNSIEIYPRTLKERTGRFCNNINARVNAIKSLVLFLSLFMQYYNHLRCIKGILSVPGGELISTSSPDRQEALLKCVRMLYMIMFSKEEQCDMNDN